MVFVCLIEIPGEYINKPRLFPTLSFPLHHSPIILYKLGTLGVWISKTNKIFYTLHSTVGSSYSLCGNGSEQNKSLSLPDIENQFIQPLNTNLPSASFIADVSVIPDPHDVQDCQEAVAGPQKDVCRKQDAQRWAETQSDEPGTCCQCLQPSFQRYVQRRELDSKQIHKAPVLACSKHRKFTVISHCIVLFRYLWTELYVGFLVPYGNCNHGRCRTKEVHIQYW